MGVYGRFVMKNENKENFAFVSSSKVEAHAAMLMLKQQTNFCVRLTRD